MKAMKLALTACCLSLVQGLSTPFAGELKIIDLKQIKLSIETDFNIGYQAYHIGKPSDFEELADEYRTSINVK